MGDDKEFLYLDSCIFVAYKYPKNSNNQHQKANIFLNKILKKRKFNLVTSLWALSEASKTLIQKRDIESEEVMEYIRDLLWTTRIGDNKFELLQPSKKEKYGFDDFFFEITKNLIKYEDYELSLADAIHITFMLNNKIKKIATFDTKHFINIQEIEAINPDDIDKYL